MKNCFLSLPLHLPFLKSFVWFPNSAEVFFSQAVFVKECTSLSLQAQRAAALHPAGECEGLWDFCCKVTRAAQELWDHHGYVAMSHSGVMGFPSMLLSPWIVFIRILYSSCLCTLNWNYLILKKYLKICFKWALIIVLKCVNIFELFWSLNWQGCFA